MSILGIDVSHFNGRVNWKEVRESGVKFAFIKATEGAFFSDNYYERNFEEALCNNINVAPYHFVSPRSNAVSQAEFFCKKLLKNPDDMLLTPVLDIEWDFKKGIDQWLNINNRERIDFIFAIITFIEDKIGRKPTIYTSKSFWDEKIHLTDKHNISNYPLWINDYHKDIIEPNLPRDWNKWTFWQFTEQFEIKGKKFDTSRYNKDSGNFSKLLK